MSVARRDGPTEDRVDRFDFERLEQSVDSLLRDHARLQAEREALMAELADREHRSSELERALEGERQRRRSALEAVDRIRARVEALQAFSTRRIAPGSGGTSGSGSPEEVAGDTEDAGR